MPSYCSLLMALCGLVIAALCVQIRRNGWLPKADKRRLQIACAAIAVSALAEWIGVQSSDNAGLPAWVPVLARCVEHSLTPLACAVLAGLGKPINRRQTILCGILCANAVFQLFACFNGWMIAMGPDRAGTRWPLSPIYIAVCALSIVCAAVEAHGRGGSLERRDRASVLAIMALVVAGIAIQEALGGEYRTARVALAVGAALMLIHDTEFYQATADELMREKDCLIMKDTLSGVFSRYAYSEALKAYGATRPLPTNLVVLTIDINGLKAVNDTAGHDAGDELIIGAARCIEKAVGDAGKCFRTGGDEFVVLARMGRDQAEDAFHALERETRAWTGSAVKELSLSAGYAIADDYAGLPIEKLVKEADKAMYFAKAEYYRRNGIDRRRSSR